MPVLDIMGGELKTRMPLEFESLSHGKIAFGFFNIETDMILLNQYFFFAEDFCHYISQAAQANEHIFKRSWEIYPLQNGADIGNLMGAIYGSDHRGFIGEIYQLFPFPKHQEDFKQKPQGNHARALMERLIQKYTSKTDIHFMMDQKTEQINIGEYLFGKLSFHKLIEYIWMGGFPRWKDNLRPDYVLSMGKVIDRSTNSLFNGLIFK
jgi:hypothetical protein